jgi:beta-glucosidase
VAAARRYDGYRNRWFLDPLFGRGYPSDMFEHYAGQLLPSLLADGDLRTIAAPIDVLGINYYHPTIVRADRHDDFLGLAAVHPPREAVTEMGWIVRPQSLRQMLRRISREYPIKHLAVTENGAAYPDAAPTRGSVRDPERTRYLRGHVQAVADAVADGVPLSGYFVWSLLDNFEWAWGMSRRFGLVHVDFETQRRTVKDSGRWYAEHIRRAQLNRG